MLTFLIVGRVNVGKSMFFKRATKGKVLSADMPGTTVDYHKKSVDICGLSITFVDTAGISSRNLDTALNSLEANAILFFIDAKVGITGDDLDIVDKLRKCKKPIHLVCNKCDSGPIYRNESSLGLKYVHYISSKNMFGVRSFISELHDIYKPDIDLTKVEITKNNTKVALIGRTNVGKSTIFNALLGYQRSLVDSKSHTTRDPVIETCMQNSVQFELIDTAGFSRNIQYHDYGAKWREMSNTAIMNSDVVILVVDASEKAIHFQDIRLLHTAIDMYKPIIVAVNKIDAVENFELDFFKSYFMHYCKPRIVAISALRLFNIHKLLYNCIILSNTAKKLIRARDLDSLTEEIEFNVPRNGKRSANRIFYIRQVKCSLPTFTVAVRHPLSGSYRKFIARRIQELFFCPGIPIRIVSKK